jgi:hypothetical protein
VERRKLLGELAEERREPLHEITALENSKMILIK